MPQEKIGMMNDGYFVGRTELLQWLNDFFQFSFSKIEQVCTGAVHCQIMDALFPGEVPLHKTVFNKLNIAKVIEVNKLIKGKHQDNLEFLQWMKKFFDLNWQGGEYDAAGRRKQAAAMAAAMAPNSSNSFIANSTALIRKSKIPQQEPNRASKKPALEINGADDEINKIRKRNAQLSIAVDNLEKERDFYFRKLRDIEILCQSNPQVPILKEVERILYSTEGVEAHFEMEQQQQQQPLFGSENGTQIILPDSSEAMGDDA